MNESKSPAEPFEAYEEALLTRLAHVLDAVDPVPERLVGLSTFALTIERMREQMIELEHVDTPALAARAAAGEREIVRTGTITFACEPVTVMITLSESPTGGLCVDGWVAPAAQYRVDLYQPDSTVSVTSDEDGAFVLFDVPEGPTCLALRRADESGPTVCTPVIEL